DALCLTAEGPLPERSVLAKTTPSGRRIGEQIMKRTVLAALCVAAAYAAPMAAADPLTYDGLKTMLTGMGYTPKDIGKTSPKIEILVVTDAFNVPIGLEI